MASPGLKWGLMLGHCAPWPASLNRYMISVDRSTTSVMSSIRLTPGTQPSSTAFFQPLPPRRCPTTTSIPLSRQFRDWPWP